MQHSQQWCLSIWFVVQVCWRPPAKSQQRVSRAAASEEKRKEMGAFCSDCLKSFSGSPGSVQYETIATDHEESSRTTTNSAATAATAVTPPAAAATAIPTTKNVVRLSSLMNSSHPFVGHRCWRRQSNEYHHSVIQQHLSIIGWFLFEIRIKRCHW